MRYVIFATIGLAGVSLMAMTGFLDSESVATVPPLNQACPAVLVQRAPVPSHCVQVRGEDVGRLPLELRLGNRAIHFAEWTQADEASADVIGFAAHLPGDVVYAVKAGDTYFSGREPRWLHPEGVAGPRVHRIEAVTFCRVQATRCGSTPIIDEGPASPTGAQLTLAWGGR